MAFLFKARRKVELYNLRTDDRTSVSMRDRFTKYACVEEEEQEEEEK